ncbi:hypothetical protein [Streptomyces sp. KMM 9044]|uniref:hypothetical protein n=1 Tax=Streptomyces sp. KMM 9044 TaxID=2744474 RepID=UPI002150A5AD|nr:hypothetical protein [Streptomyces sp. KMM 9044]WAX82223.1 hypothetical protein HUV60_033285 [Streptomyces sp. KMM 9044]
MPDEQPVRLCCFAPSGEGPSVFDDWAASVGPGARPVPVLLPGCTMRRTEPPMTAHRALLAAGTRPLPYTLLAGSPRPSADPCSGHRIRVLVPLSGPVPRSGGRNV